jgi:dTDP-4-amino-4,6-dideoxygalactose transaminase
MGALAAVQAPRGPETERMYARKRLDIGWLDLASGLVNAGLPLDRATLARRIEHWFSPDGGALCTLSIRSGLELYLEQQALPKGSEVLMSALTIPDMWKVVERHGLVPVPVDVDTRTLAPKLDGLAKAATGKTRMLIVAHLFGTRFDLAPYARVARERGWLLLEDCAQAFTGPDYLGHPAADVSMFSFGPIKTSAALAGGVLVVRDRPLLTQMRAVHAQWPVQSGGTYAKRVLKYAGLKAVSNPVLYRGFVKWCELKGTNQDAVIQGTVRGFAGGDFWAKIRHQPSAPLLSVIERRVFGFQGRRVASRTEIARELVARTAGRARLPGIEAPFHSFWVFTILVDEPARAVELLRRHGYDATQVATLSAVPAPPGREDLDAREARAMLAQMVYLPVYPELPMRKIDELGALLRSAAPVADARTADVGYANLA